MKNFFIFIFVLIFVSFVSAVECDNIGERTSTQYCSVDGQWNSLKNDGATGCENNFECRSGNCIEGFCYSTSAKEEYEKQKSLIANIWAWLSGKECLTIGEISNGKYCDPDYKWQSLEYGGSACENDYECLSDDCTSDGFCTCSDDDECAAGYTCVDDDCIKIECTSNSDCDAGYSCNVNGICELNPSGCNSNADCTPEVCDTITKTCVECLTNSDCSSSTEECKDNICVTVSTGGGGNGGGNGGGTLTDLSGSQYQSRSGFRDSIGNNNLIEKIFSSISPNRLYYFAINELPISATKISFITNTELKNVKFVVKGATEKASDIPKPEGLVYTYFHLTTQNIQDSNLEKAEIAFRVAKSWLTQNNLKYYKVVLQRYTTKWNIIKPVLTAEDTTYLYYSALTPGFSWFAITSIPEKPTTPYVQVTQAEPECGDGMIDLGEACDTCPQDVSCLSDEVCKEGRCIIKKKTSILVYILPPIIIVLVILAIIIYKKRMKKPLKLDIAHKKSIFPSKTAESSLKNYIEKALHHKLSKEKIKENLIKRGWTESQIEFIFKHLGR